MKISRRQLRKLISEAIGDADGDGRSNAEELMDIANSMSSTETPLARGIRLTGPGGALELGLGDAQVANLPIDIEEYIIQNPGITDEQVITAYEEGEI